MKNHEIICGDTDQLITNIEDDSVDLVITDPPYKDYISLRTKNRAKQIVKGSFSFQALITQIERVLKPHRHFYIWCDSKTYSEAFEAIKNSKHLIFKNMLVWVKNNHGSGDLKGAYAPQHELCIFGSHGKGRDFFSSRRSDVLFKKDDKGCILFYPRVDPKIGGHPTIKPHEIIIDFIKRSSKPDEVVFDPYAGSFSTAICAKQLKRYSLSFELDKSYCNIGKKRLSASNST